MAYVPLPSSAIMQLRPLSILPAIAFAVLATFLLYASVRGYRRIFPSSTAVTSSKSASLPAPVVGKSSGWSWAKLNLKSGWPRRLSLSGIPRVRVRVPWSRSSSLDSGVVHKTKNSKNLGIELLPTTGLPPHPSSLPTPTPTPPASHVLVDVSVSSPPSSTHVSSAPETPRPPSPPAPINYFSGAKALLLPLHHNARPTSPRALLVTTTPPKNHKRSRSLGGVPVRRLSSGAGSALRNAMEMDDLGVRNGHVRDTSREHLLIDFSSSSSSGRGRGEVEDDPDISPAASDIGVLPLNAPLRTRSDSAYGYGYEAPLVAPPPPLNSTPIAVLPKQVARQVPLVDLEEEEDDTWKWFSDAPVVAPAILPALPVVRAMISSTAAIKSMEMKPIGIKTEKLVDLDEPVEVKARAAGLVSEVKLIDIEERNYEEAILVDVSEKPVQGMPQPEPVITRGDIVAPKAEIAVREEDVPLPIVSVDQGLAEVLEDPFADPPHTVSVAASSPVDVANNPFADPYPAPASYELPPSPPSRSVALSTEQDQTDSSNETRPATLEESPETWTWEDSHDPWHGHIVDVEPQTVDATQQSEGEIVPEVMSSHDQILGEALPIEQDAVHAAVGGEEALLEHSPAGVLVPIAVDEEEEEEHIPPLDLYVEEKKGDEATSEHKDDEADEETPKATPASLAQELPPWSPLEALPIDEDDYYGVAEEASNVEAHSAPVSPEMLSTTLSGSQYDDPELLDLPLADEPVARVHSHEEATYYGPTAEEISLVLTNAGSVLFSVDKPSDDVLLERGDGQHTPTKTPLAQTPTPPASPPPPSHSLSLSTRALKFGSNHNSRAVSPVAFSVPALVLSVTDKLDLGADEAKVSKAPVASRAALEDDKENIALPLSSKSSDSEDNVAQTRPAWSIRAQDAPALGVPSAGYVLGTSPRTIKRALSSESQKDNSPVSVEEAEPVTFDISKEAQAADPVVAVVESASKTEAVPAVNDAPTSAPPKETQPIIAPEIVRSDSLPGTFPESATISKVEVIPSSDDTPSSPTAATSTAVSTTAITAVPNRRRTLSGALAYTIPSVRRLVRSPLDVALAMQLRPGLGAGADPAWMVRFLMAMYGWLAVVIAGQDF
ncbi:hypothetical protein D9619_009561 [Psilocybe cf. subviscida]|uniref:Uncharacterized protein n=1 Tax=Psilocybe cf. subviscida TaxID=2480587 RepID=A0A8H5BMG0_9AGAR|nr:hypothetical protein D9619_009561 [Psilocybe cf. subviscida]